MSPCWDTGVPRPQVATFHISNATQKMLRFQFPETLPAPLEGVEQLGVTVTTRKGEGRCERATYAESIECHKIHKRSQLNFEVRFHKRQNYLHLINWELLIGGFKFQTCGIFSITCGIIWNNPSHWHIFFKMVKTTNHIVICPDE